VQQQRLHVLTFIWPFQTKPNSLCAVPYPITSSTRLKMRGELLQGSSSSSSSSRN
jgi:hypothetical protein